MDNEKRSSKALCFDCDLGLKGRHKWSPWLAQVTAIRSTMGCIQCLQGLLQSIAEHFSIAISTLWSSSLRTIKSQSSLETRLPTRYARVHGGASPSAEVGLQGGMGGAGETVTYPSQSQSLDENRRRACGSSNDCSLWGMLYCEGCYRKMNDGAATVYQYLID